MPCGKICVKPSAVNIIFVDSSIFCIFAVMKQQNDKETYVTVLSIAGSDSIGGAGIQADIKTCTALGVYAMTAITAITAQNTMGVNSYVAVDDDMLRGQLQAVIDDVRPDAVKIGMLPTVAAVKTVAEFIKKHKLDNVVLDPVCVATSGDALTAETVPGAMREYLFPLATLVTPNLSEAQLLSGMEITDPETFAAAAEAILSQGAHAVLMKGGHHYMANRDTATDVLFIAGAMDVPEYSAPFVNTANTHGTGCTYSSAIASFLGSGMPLCEAIGSAKAYVSEAIIAGADKLLGHGHGPLCHFYKVLEK